MTETETRTERAIVYGAEHITREQLLTLAPIDFPDLSNVAELLEKHLDYLDWERWDSPQSFPSLEELIESIHAEGLHYPLEVTDGLNEQILSDGYHRAIALLVMDYEDMIPIRWYDGTPQAPVRTVCRNTWRDWHTINDGRPPHE